MTMSSLPPTSALPGALIACLLLAGGCSARPDQGPRPPVAPEVIAERYRDARKQLRDDPAEAETAMRSVLADDPFNGPALNDLGVLLLNKGELYEAVTSFERARKQLPGHPAPRANLAMALERAGKVDEAIEAARAALEVQADYLPAIQVLALVQIRSGRTDDQTRALLDAIAIRSADPTWRRWAEQARLRQEARR